MRFNNRVSALLNIPDLPTGAFEKQHLTMRLYGGSIVEKPLKSANDFIGDTAESVGDFIGDTAETVGDFIGDTAEAVGDAAEAVGDVIGDAATFIDKNVLQPMIKDPVGSIATIAAIASQQYYLLPVIAGANTAIKGGRIEDIALSAGLAYAGAKFAPGINQWAGGGLTGAVTTGAALGASGAGSAAAIRGQDVGEAILQGGVVGGVLGGVGYGVSQGYDTIRSELGYRQATPPTIQADADFLAAQAESLRTQPGGVSDQYMADILRQEGVNSFVAQDVAQLTNQNIGQAAVAQNIAGSYQPGEIYTPPPIQDNLLEKTGKKLVTEAISGSILDGIYGSNTPEDPMGFLTFRRRGRSFGDDMFEGEADTSLNLTAVQPDKFELRKYANPEGQSTLISFKDDQPQQPIPSGYAPVETIGAAEGGLISTNMVKYSKKPLLAKRKPDVEKKVTTRKGLAGKQS